MSYIGASPTTSAFVTDQFSANGSGTVFTLSVAPANTSSILVSVSGVLQSPDTYSVSGTTLTFSAAPPAGTGNISVRFLGIPASGVTTTAYRTVTEFTATAGQTTFTPPSYTVGYINVYRNGALLGTADYTATNGTTVVLASAASSGDLVVVESFYVSSVVGAIPATNGAVTSAYLLDGSVTQAKLGTNVAGNGPAFFTNISTNQTISNGTTTKVLFNSETYDTNSCYDASNSRFLPNIAGYYQLSCAAYVGASASSFLTIYKNGNAFARGTQINSSVSMQQSSVLMYMNGTTDYAEVYFTNNTGGSVVVEGYDFTTNFTGFLARAA